MAIQSADTVSGLACIDVEAFPKDIVADGRSKPYISHLHSMGVDIQTIQSLSNHGDIDMMRLAQTTKHQFVSNAF